MLLNLCRGCVLREDDVNHAAVATEAQADTSTGWVARVALAKRGRWPLFRNFLNPHAKQIEPAPDGAREKLIYEPLPDGFYEADSIMRSFVSFRTYFIVRGGEIELLPGQSAAVERLRAQAEAKALVALRGAPELDLE